MPERWAGGILGGGEVTYRCLKSHLALICVYRWSVKYLLNDVARSVIGELLNVEMIWADGVLRTELPRTVKQHC